MFLLTLTSANLSSLARTVCQSNERNKQNNTTYARTYYLNDDYFYPTDEF